MEINIIIAGVGGQGILTIAAVLDTAALSQNLHVKQSEVHGMSQRGGAVQSHVRISDKQVYSDLIPQGRADMILSVEPLESLRYIPFLKKEGWIITDSQSFENIANYPSQASLLMEIRQRQNHLLLDATEEAKDLGNSKAANMVLLGAASTVIPLSEESIKHAIKKLFAGKSEKITELNLKAFERGKVLAKEALKKV